MSEVVLAAQGLVKRFGGITATDNVSLRLERGARHALIGPNGAGKTTAFDLISGFQRADAGRVIYDGSSIVRKSPADRESA